MPNRESMNADRFSGESSIHDSNRRRGASTMKGYNADRAISDLSEEERKKLVSDALDEIFGPSGGSSSRGNATSSTARRAETTHRTPETRTVSPEARATRERAKKNKGFKRFLAGITVAAVAAAMVTGGIWYGKNQSRQQQPPAPSQEPAFEFFDDSRDDAERDTPSPYAGEQWNGTFYDYSHYADQEHKSSKNAYDYDYSDDFNNRERTVSGIVEVATRTPEALASYAFNVFTDEEKAELGISGLSMTEIDDRMSNSADGGTLQRNLLERLDTVLNSDQTSYNFYYENDTEDTNYIYFVDDNNDGKMTPDELHLGYSTRKRNGAPQVDVYRLVPTGEYRDGAPVYEN